MDPAAHTDPAAALVLLLAIILACAKLGGDVAVRLRQPPVLGELIAGVLVGNAHLLGVHWFDALGTSETLDVLARLGVILLLFEVGLESTVGQMMKVGLSALLVATVGVVAPFALGWLVCALVLPDQSIYAHLFVGATLCATSVGITARVFKDLNASHTREARIVLGAAVIDDVQGLIVLAVVTGVIAAGTVSFVTIGVVVGKAALFLVGALFLGVVLSRRLFHLAAKLRARGVLLATGLSVCFVLAWAADAIGLAPLVGAFAAGLILEDAHVVELRAHEDRSLGELVAPITSLLAPVFFVLMGTKTDLTALTDVKVLGLAALLIVAAVIGKVVAGFAALPSRGGGAVLLAQGATGPAARVDRLVVGVGMIPRGEVGLIFANLGQTLVVGGAPVVSSQVFSAVVVTVLATTVITPPLLRSALARRGATASASEPATPSPAPPA